MSGVTCLDPKTVSSGNKTFMVFGDLESALGFELERLSFMATIFESILFSRQNARKAEKIFVLAILLRFSRRNCFPKVVPLTKVTPPATSTDTVKNSFTGCIVVSIYMSVFLPSVSVTLFDTKNT